MYRGAVGDIGGAYNVNNGVVRTITMGIRFMMSKAIAKAASGGQYLQGTLDDYYLVAVTMGWETIGYEEIQSQISAVSLNGSTRTMFDGQVYDDQYYKDHNPDLASNGVVDAGLRRAHWVKYGVGEGRVASAIFSPPAYLAKYDDVRQVYGATNYQGAIDHYVFYGRNEGRSTP